jgi:hypothetical protein
MGDSPAKTMILLSILLAFPLKVVSDARSASRVTMLKARLLLPVLAAAVLFMTTPACATGYYQRYPDYRQVQDRAYRNGFNEGREQGENDARRGRSFDYGRHSEYRNAQIGYGGYGNRNEYRNVFRRGFQEGYNEGYRRYARDRYYRR